MLKWKFLYDYSNIRTEILYKMDTKYFLSLHSIYCTLVQLFILINKLDG